MCEEELGEEDQSEDTGDLESNMEEAVPEVKEIDFEEADLLADLKLSVEEVIQDSALSELSRDISILSSHIFDGKDAVCMVHQQEPWGVVWCVLSDGTLATMTLQQEHQVTAWTRQNINAFVYSVCSVPGDGQDDLYLYTKRNGTYCLERLAKRIDKTNEPSVFTDGFGLSPTPVVSTLECLDWERPLNSGPSQGRVRDMSSVMVRVFRTCGMMAGVFTEGNSYPILDEVRMIPFGPARGSATPITADISIPITGGNGRICRLIIKNTQSRPITILGVFPQIVSELEGNV